MERIVNRIVPPHLWSGLDSRGPVLASSAGWNRRLCPNIRGPDTSFRGRQSLPPNMTKRFNFLQQIRPPAEGETATTQFDTKTVSGQSGGIKWTLTLRYCNHTGQLGPVGEKKKPDKE
ncbi:uncharacterized protein [Macrobrachium rosenbergii]|uniref:uncharacterized protein n=1 Tax=Macrobrachium rosenbergii TaxID=79674 RepID=UPI0034D5A9C0